MPTLRILGVQAFRPPTPDWGPPRQEGNVVAMRWLVGYDGSAGAQTALQWALRLAPQVEADLCLLSVVEPLPSYAAQEEGQEPVSALASEYFAAVQSEACEEAARAGVVATTAIRAGPVAATIAAFAREGQFDLVLVGADSVLARRRHLGSVADRVGQLAPCAVLIAR